MKKSIVTLCLSLACVTWALGQDVQSRSTGSAQSETSATANTETITLDAGTRFSAELQKTLDVRTASVGDEVVLKTTQSIKSGGRVVVEKGARLFGRVTDVAKRGKDSSSRIGILFNRLEKGPAAMQIKASIVSITNVAGTARIQGDDAFAGGGSSRSTTSASSGSLLGGVGAVVNSTTATLGSPVISTTSAVGVTANEIGSLGAIQISQSSNTSVQGESVLSLQGGNLRLEKGAKFNLVVTQSVQ